MLKSDPESALQIADRIIKNTYRTLMTRGQKGCFVFCVDRETNEYFRQFMTYADGKDSAKPGWRRAAEPDGHQDSGRNDGS